MALRRTSRQRRAVPRGLIFQLCVGRDLFRDGEPDPMRLREWWQDEEIRRQVFERQEQRRPGVLPWAAKQFDE